MNFHGEQLGLMPSLAMLSPCEDREGSWVTGSWVSTSSFLEWKGKGQFSTEGWSCSYLGMHGSSVGSGPFSAHGALFEFSRTPWPFVTVAIHYSDYSYGWLSDSPSLIHLAHPMIHEAGVTLTWKRTSITQALLQQHVPFCILLYITAPTKPFFFFQNKVWKKNKKPSYWISALSLSTGSFLNLFYFITVIEL